MEEKGSVREGRRENERKEANQILSNSNDTCRSIAT